MAVKKKLATVNAFKRAKASIKKVLKKAPIKATKKAPNKAASKARPRVRVATVRKAASQPRVAQSKPSGKSNKPLANGKPAIFKKAVTNGVVNEEKRGKVAQTEAKLSKADLEHFRELLLDKRREILGDVGSMESEAFKNQDNHSNSPMHMADVGTDNFEQEFTLGLIESERELLREIHEAIGRIEDGTYGICAGTGKYIRRARLEATPWAKYCIEYARMLESGLVNHEAVGERSGHDSEEEEE